MNWTIQHLRDGSVLHQCDGGIQGLPLVIEEFVETSLSLFVGGRCSCSPNAIVVTMTFESASMFLYPGLQTRTDRIDKVGSVLTHQELDVAFDKLNNTDFSRFESSVYSRVVAACSRWFSKHDRTEGLMKEVDFIQRYDRYDDVMVDLINLREVG